MNTIMQTAQGMLASALRRAPPFRGTHKLFSVADRTIGRYVGPIAVCTMAKGHQLKLDRRSLTEKTAYYTGRYDDEPIELLCRLLRPRDTALDVGSNIGFYAVPTASHLKPIGGHLHAFEPVHANYTRLQENIAINGLQACVTTHECALASRSGTAVITLREDFVAGSQTGNAAIAFSKDDTKRFSVEDITLYRLDDLAQKIPLERIDLIKLDVEGHEDEVLRGATGTIKRFLPIVYLEVNKHYYRWRQVDLWSACKDTIGESHFALLPKWQRRTAWLTSKRLLGFQRIEDISACAEIDNIFLVPPQRIADFAAIAPVSD
jgi:FkbM family methyltransferase